MGATIPLTLDTAYKLNCVCNARVLASRYRYKICIPHGERTKINYKYRIAQYIDLVKNEYLYLVFRARAFTFSKVFEKACNVCRNSCTIFLFIGRTDIAGCSMLICTPLYFATKIGSEVVYFDKQVFNAS